MMLDRAFFDDYWSRRPCASVWRWESGPSLDDVSAMFARPLRSRRVQAWADGKLLPNSRLSQRQLGSPFDDADVDLELLLDVVRRGGSVCVEDVDLPHDATAMCVSDVRASFGPANLHTRMWLLGVDGGAPVKSADEHVLVHTLQGETQIDARVLGPEARQSERVPTRFATGAMDPTWYAPSHWEVRVEVSAPATVIAISWSDRTWVDELRAAARRCATERLELRRALPLLALQEGAQNGAQGSTQAVGVADKASDGLAELAEVHLRVSSALEATVAGMPAAISATDPIKARSARVADFLRAGQLTAATLVRRTQALALRVETTDGRIVVYHGRKAISLPDFVGEALERLLQGRPVTVGGPSSALDDTSSVVLAKRLVQEGVLDIAGTVT